MSKNREGKVAFDDEVAQDMENGHKKQSKMTIQCKIKIQLPCDLQSTITSQLQ